MIDPKKPSAATPTADARPAYEPPRLTRKKAVVRATLFTGQGGQDPGTTTAPPSPLTSTG